MHDDLRPSLLAGLIGAGIQRSLSPAMHQQEGDAQGLRYVYKRIDLEALGLTPDALPELLTAAERFGFAGLNITHPCKQRVLHYLDDLSDDARALGAVNTVVFDNGRRIGHNTDWWGFAESFKRGLPGAPMGQVVQLGAGGAGAAVAHAMLTLGAQSLTLFDVEPERARLPHARRRRHGRVPGGGRVRAVHRHRAECAPDAGPLCRAAGCRGNGARRRHRPSRRRATGHRSRCRCARTLSLFAAVADGCARMPWPTGLGVGEARLPRAPHPNPKKPRGRTPARQETEVTSILVLNGPNLNLLGTREPAVYGHETLADVERLCREEGERLGHAVACRQSNHEGQLIDWIHEAGRACVRGELLGIVLNAGALTHTSLALHDAIKGASVPVIEYHISNVHAREPFRHHSWIAPAARAVMAGLGVAGYALALRALVLVAPPRQAA